MKHTCCRGNLHRWGSCISCFVSSWSESARSESLTSNLSDATTHTHTHLLRMYRRVCVSFCRSLTKPAEQWPLLGSRAQIHKHTGRLFYLKWWVLLLLGRHSKVNRPSSMTSPACGVFQLRSMLYCKSTGGRWLFVGKRQQDSAEVTLHFLALLLHHGVVLTHTHTPGLSNFDIHSALLVFSSPEVVPSDSNHQDSCLCFSLVARIGGPLIESGAMNRHPV